MVAELEQVLLSGHALVGALAALGQCPAPAALNEFKGALEQFEHELRQCAEERVLEASSGSLFEATDALLKGVAPRLAKYEGRE